MKYLYTALMAAMALSACNKKDQTATELPETVASATSSDSAAVVSATATTTPAPSAAPSPQITAAPQINQVAPAATAPGMNPPHGQPNHRCDIPVGAPLSTPAQANSVQAPSVMPQNSVTSPALNPVLQPQPAAQATAPGMNPPHGQPNHRCDIPVGAPLNS